MGSHPGFRFASPWATILRRFAAQRLYPRLNGSIRGSTALSAAQRLYPRLNGSPWTVFGLAFQPLDTLLRKNDPVSGEIRFAAAAHDFGASGVAQTNRRLKVVAVGQKRFTDLKG